MTGRRISPLMAWGIVVLLLITATVGIASPLVELHGERQARIDTLVDLINTRTTMIDRGKILAERREVLSQRDDRAFGIIPAHDTTAVAHLQEVLRVVAAAQDLRIDSLRVLPDRVVTPLREVAVRASLTGSVAQVQRLLHGLETGRPMVRVSKLDLLSRQGTSDLEITLVIAALAESTTNAD